MNKIALVLYRALLRECNRISRSVTSLHLRGPVEGQWGSYKSGHVQVDATAGSPTTAYQLEALEQLLPGLEDLPRGFPVIPQEMKRIIRANFELHRKENTRIAEDYTALDQGFSALRTLPYLAYLEQCSSSNCESDVLVEVTSAALPPKPAEGSWVYSFSYRVRVTNLRADHIKIMGRGWFIIDGEGQLSSVVPFSRTNAVVGQQPVLPPGAYFEYYSGAALSTPSGFMKGRLAIDICKGVQGKYDTEEELELEIARFNLLQPASGSQ